MRDERFLEELPDNRRKFLRQLFSEGFSAGKYQNPRWLREDLYNSYSTVFGSMTGFSEVLDDLVYQQLVGMDVSTSDSSVRYHLHRRAIDALAAVSDDRIDSSRWTGRELSALERVELARNIDDALSKVESLRLTQEKRSQVRALLLAARSLSEAPEPPLDILKMLFGDVDRLIGIAGFLVGVAGLIVAS